MAKTERKSKGTMPPQITRLDVKAIVRHRDGYRCTQCGIKNEEYFKRRKRALDVHRLVPGSPYTVDGCVTLCDDCHGTQPMSPIRKRSDPESDASPLSFGKMVQRLRLAAGMTQQQLADKCKITHSTLRQWENGLRGPNWSSFLDLVDALGVPGMVFWECVEERLQRGRMQT